MNWHIAASPVELGDLKFFSKVIRLRKCSYTDGCIIRESCNILALLCSVLVLAQQKECKACCYLYCVSAYSSLGIIKLIYMKLRIRKFQDSNTFLWTAWLLKMATLFKQNSRKHTTSDTVSHYRRHESSHSNFF